MKYGDKGPGVRGLQRYLGVAQDGDFGPNTMRALVSACALRGIRPSWEVPAEITKLAFEGILVTMDAYEKLGQQGPFFDLRHEFDMAYDRAKLVRGKVRMRKPEEVMRLCLHQAAVMLPGASVDRKRAGGDKDLASVFRATRKTACHLVGFTSGMFVVKAPFLAEIYGGNKWNGTSLHLEVEGKYGGNEAPHPTEKTLQGVKDGLLEARKLWESEGINITEYVAHRQASPTRRADPGVGIYQGLSSFLEQELDMSPNHDTVLWHKSSRSWGLPIPESWGGTKGESY